MINHKAIGLLSNNGPDPLKITKLPSQRSMLGHLIFMLNGVKINLIIQNFFTKNC